MPPPKDKEKKKKQKQKHCFRTVERVQALEPPIDTNPWEVSFVQLFKVITFQFPYL